jgi:hypothetical protein
MACPPVELSEARKVIRQPTGRPDGINPMVGCPDASECTPHADGMVFGPSSHERRPTCCY